MLGISLKKSAGYDRTVGRLMRFFKDGPTKLQHFLDQAVMDELQEARDSIRQGLISDSLGLERLSPATVARKRQLAKRGLVSSNPSIPLVRLKEIYENIEVIRLHSGNIVLFVKDSMYSHKDTPKRTTNRTVGDIALIHASGNLGPSGKHKREIFPQDMITQIKHKLIQSISKGIKMFVKGGK